MARRGEAKGVGKGMGVCKALAWLCKEQLPQKRVAGRLLAASLAARAELCAYIPDSGANAVSAIDTATDTVTVT